jgi:GT2 family glycosyltransferase
MITISVVSHGHGAMLAKLLEQVLAFPEIEQVIVTLNIPESIQLPKDRRIILIQNQEPKGFGVNHNYAFTKSKSSHFCVLNPDIAFDLNPFPYLLGSLLDAQVGLVAPIIKNEAGSIEDSIRTFLTPMSILRRRLLGHREVYQFKESDPNFCVEWVGGMCMLFPSSAYAAINGFDEQYFMYVEDADICTRLWLSGYKVLACPSAAVIHDARRASRKNWQHFRWHITSLMRYFWKYTGRLPRLP